MPASIYAFNNPAFRSGGPLTISGTANNGWQNAAYSWTPTVTGGSGTRSFAVTTGALPTGLTIDSATGNISGTPTAIANTTGIVITVTDSSGSQTLTISINIVAQLTISGTPATTGTQGSAYSFTPSSTGGLGTKTFSINFSTIPGISFNTTTGAYSGTPTQAASQSGIIISVTDSIGTVSLASFNLTIASNLSISGTPGSGTQGSAYSFTPTTTDGTGSYTYNLQTGTLPTGLTLNTSTGEIAGTPSGTGTSSGITIRVTDSLGSTADLGTFSITINAAGGTSNFLLEDGVSRLLLEDGTSILLLEI
jgi:hypothetical protein